MLLAVLFLILLAITLLCVGFGLAYFRSQQKNQIRAMLLKAEASPAEQRSSHMLLNADADSMFHTLLSRYQLVDRLDLLLDQAGLDWTSAKLVNLCLATGIAGFAVGLKLRLLNVGWSALLLGILLSSLPLLFVLRKRSKSVSDFEGQLPDALDFLSRSMRAGHGFAVAMEMLAADAPDPLGRAFRKVANDIQLGSALDVALQKLVQQIPLIDVRFFVSAVVLQQETGGNLGEILSKLAEIIRDRFRLRGTVKAAAAHGKVTGMVLIFMPRRRNLFLDNQ